MDLDSVANVRAAFYRLVGTDATDSALTENGELVNDVAYLFLTDGSRAAQRWMLKMGYKGWRKRSAALSFSGSDTADGGRYTALPADFLRAIGDRHKSALVEANGDRWGAEITTDEDQIKGNFYFIRGEELWLARNAQVPTTLYLEYHYRHPVWSDAVTMDFPLEARSLIVAEAADAAKEENWLPGGPELERKIQRALTRAREKARDVSRPTKQSRQVQRPRVHGTRW